MRFLFKVAALITYETLLVGFRDFAKLHDWLRVLVPNWTTFLRQLLLFEQLFFPHAEITKMEVIIVIERAPSPN